MASLKQTVISVIWYEVFPASQRNLERETGIEPATSSLGSWHSTAELLPPSAVRGFRLTSKTDRLQEVGPAGVEPCSATQAVAVPWAYPRHAVPVA